jgi:uncharacterized damage-inducible protein DinB
MSERPLPLMIPYKGWGTYQQMLVQMVTPLTPEQLASPSAANHWTIGQIAQHMVANRVWWFQLWMGEGRPELAPIVHWDPADPVEVAPRTTPELVDGLEATWEMIATALNHWTAADLGRMFPPPDALSAEERENYGPTSRQWIIWHVLEHEIHHGGELSLALGIYGLPGIYGGV